ncbi:histone deacetylase 15-like [Planoprotostelium fungivorum]|uniref:Histone deacetylase 15-like n=1 Tax=Planoprotostelium fungivorum TaxID=1890364 RepID=A0A2P6MN86_9EUKA|nr:histone deacetylase 15-like [Planoprotostelium fungivorum]
MGSGGLRGQKKKSDTKEDVQSPAPAAPSSKPTSEPVVLTAVGASDASSNETSTTASSSKTGIVFDERMKLHFAAKKHPERPERLDAIIDLLRAEGILDKCILCKSRSVTDNELCLAHSNKHMETVSESVQKSIDREADVYFTNDTYCNKDSATVARMSAGCLIELTERVVRGELSNGFAIIRPPGHHAEREKVMGFCLYNNVAIASLVATEKLAVHRVLVVDWDVHHGNGTQQILDAMNNVLYFSVHRHEDKKFYPGTGSIDEVGSAKGFSVNVPWAEKGYGDAEYLWAFHKVLLPIAREFDPDLVIISAGFDCAAGDPVGGMNVSVECFGKLTQLVRDTQREKKVVMALEGGYNTEVISKATLTCVKTLLGEEWKNDDCPLEDEVAPSARQTVKDVIWTQSQYWKNLKQQLVTDLRLQLELSHGSCVLLSNKGNMRSGQDQFPGLENSFACPSSG